MKNIVVAMIAILLMVASVKAEVDVVGPGPAPALLPVVTQDVYFHVGPLNLTVPWANVNVVYLYDFMSERNLIGGESVVVSLWRLQGTIGAVTTLEGKGTPFLGGNLWFDNPIPQLAILNQIKPGIFGGWNWESGRAILGVKAAFNVFG